MLREESINRSLLTYHIMLYCVNRVPFIYLMEKRENKVMISLIDWYKTKNEPWEKKPKMKKHTEDIWEKENICVDEGRSIEREKKRRTRKRHVHACKIIKHKT